MTRVDTGIQHSPRVDTGIQHLPRVDTGIQHLPRVDTGIQQLPRVDTGIQHLLSGDADHNVIFRVYTGQLLTLLLELSVINLER